jgi:putative endonuclease
MAEALEFRGRLGWLRRRIANRKPVTLGDWGEWIALLYLRRQKWDILTRNWKSGKGELDLVACEQGELVFVEVKTRFSGGPVLPEAQLNDRKREQLERLAWRFRMRYGLTEQNARFDLIAIETADRVSYVLRHYVAVM